MAESVQMTRRDWLEMTVGVVVLACGLLALSVPVFLTEYDQWGIQINCGNGYSSNLLHASVTDHVDQCMSAVAHRRMWALPIVALGALLCAAEATKWARIAWANLRSPQPQAWVEAPDDYMHEAASLDRRERPYRERPSGTTW